VLLLLLRLCCWSHHFNRLPWPPPPPAAAAAAAAAAAVSLSLTVGV